jgi:hypothetical protein
MRHMGIERRIVVLARGLWEVGSGKSCTASDMPHVLGSDTTCD